MRTHSDSWRFGASWRLGVLLAVLAMAWLPVTAGATGPVLAGIDLFASANGTGINFSDNPIPAGFFPGCSTGFAGFIPMKGKPIAASPLINPADTIITRLQTANITVGQSATIQIQATAICLVNNAWVDPCGNTWKVSARLATAQGLGSMTIIHSLPSGGTFNSSLPVNGEVTFTDGVTTLGPVADRITMTQTGACWSHTPGPGAITVTGPVTIDRNCDGALDTTLPTGTTNFFPGWCPPASGTGNPTQQTITHSGPHPVTPPIKCKPATQTLSGKAVIAPGEINPIPICPIVIEPVPVE